MSRREAWGILAPWLFRIVAVCACGFWLGWRGLVCAFIGGLRLTVKP